jgi:hypothetical protein
MGIAVVPRSVLGLAPAKAQLNVTRLPAAIAQARTQLVWRSGHHSTPLEMLKPLALSQATAGTAARSSRV